MHLLRLVLWDFAYKIINIKSYALFIIPRNIYITYVNIP